MGDSTKSTIEFFLSREVTPPNRAGQYEAGIDFFIPAFKSSFLSDLISKNAFLLHRDNTVETDTDEGISVFKFDVLKSKMYINLNPHERILIPSGVFCKMSSNDRALIAANKSGVASRHGLIFGSQVVDSTYQGEIHISLINTSNDVVRVYEDMKAIQFVETPVYLSDIVFKDKIYDTVSYRGTNGFGSTDEKRQIINE